MDQDNPAVLQHTTVPPALLEEVEKDPRALSGVARKLLLVQVDMLQRIFRDPRMPVGQRQAYAEFLAKIGDAYPKANAAVAAGPGFSIVINIPQPGTKTIAASELSADITDAEIKVVSDHGST